MPNGVIPSRCDCEILAHPFKHICSGIASLHLRIIVFGIWRSSYMSVKSIQIKNMFHNEFCFCKMLVIQFLIPDGPLSLGSPSCLLFFPL